MPENEAENRDKDLKVCELCGASIYPEHIHSGRAAILDEKLLCPFCLNEKKGESQTPLSAEGEGGVTLIEEGEMEKSGRKIIRNFGSVAGHQVMDETKLSRQLQKSGSGATRVKIFHTKMNDGAIEFLCQTINEWVDHNPEVDIKIVQTTVGVWEGKHPEPHLILSVWY